MSEAVIRVPLPLAFARALGRLEGSSHLQDLTVVLDEWAVLLNPVAAVRRNAGDVLAASGWEMAARVALTNTNARLLREAAKDGEVIAAFRESSRFASFVQDGALDDDRAVAVVVALAIAASIRAGVGRESARMRKTLLLQPEWRNGAQASGGASGAVAKPDAITLAERPRLAELPSDLRAP